MTIERVHKIYQIAKMWLSIKSALVIGSLCCIAGNQEVDGLSCPPPFLGSSCRDCPLPQCVFNYKDNISYLHKDMQLFLEEEVLVYGRNIFEVAHVNDSLRYSIYRSLPSNVTNLNEYMCNGINRKSKFCSKCKNGHAPSPYTYYGIPCTRCSPNSLHWLYYILLELGFPTIIFAIFLTFRVRFGYMVGFAFYCQAISYIFNTPFFYQLLMEKSRTLTITLLTLYGIWNLDFFRFIIPCFCVSDNLGTLDVVVLGYISAFYPLLLTAMVYSLTKLYRNGYKLVIFWWQPFNRYVVRFQRRIMRLDTSLVNVFATIFLLAYSKIIIVSLLVLQPQTFFVFNPGAIFRTSVDPNIKYFHQKHLLYALPALLILLTVGIIPVVILCTYPSRYGRKVFRKCKFTASADFAMLVDAFQNSFKDGTNGSHDYRAVSSIYTFHRVFLYGSFSLLKNHKFFNNDAFILQAVLYIATFAFYSYARPYKSNIHNSIELVLMALLTAQCLLTFSLYDGCFQYTDLETCSRYVHRNIIIQFCILCIPQCVFMMYIIWLIGKKVKTLVSPRQHSFSLQHPNLHKYTSIG